MLFKKYSKIVNFQKFKTVLHALASLFCTITLKCRYRYYLYFTDEETEVFFFKKTIYLFLERGKGREKGRERNIDWLLVSYILTGDKTCNLGMCPDQELNW